MTDDAFAGAIMKEPADPLNYLAYADWLEEQNRPDESFAFRWMAKHGKRPFQRLKYKSGISVPGKYSWGWYRGQPRRSGVPQADPPAPGTAYLPRSVFAEFTSAGHSYYHSWRAAVLKLADVLKIVRQDVAA